MSASLFEQLKELFPDHEVLEEDRSGAHYLIYDEVELMMNLGMLQGEALWLRLQLMALPLEEDEKYYDETPVELVFIDLDHPPSEGVDPSARPINK